MGDTDEMWATAPVSGDAAFEGDDVSGGCGWVVDARALVDVARQPAALHEHGATVGQLEEEELFYLMTRGLPETLAKNLLTYGFAEQVINKIGIESIKSELDEMVLRRLSTVL